MSNPPHPDSLAPSLDVPGWTAEARRGAALDWRRVASRAHEGELAIFENRSIDAVFRSPWWWPYVVALPAACAGLVVDVLAESLLVALGWAAAGVGTWTLFEYALHRFLFHAPGNAKPIAAWLFLVHGHHHAHPRDRSRLTATPWQAGLVIAGAYGLSSALGAHGVPFACGFTLGYVAYEAAHFVAHHGKPRSRWLRTLRAHHLRHHHEDPTSRWGIGSRLWDRVFGTLGRASRAPLSD